MTNGWYTAALLTALGLTATSAFGFVDEPKPVVEANVPKRSMAESLAKIKAEYDAEFAAMLKEAEKAATADEGRRIWGKLAPDDVAYSRRMIELALSSPADPASRDALLWVINKPGWFGDGPYGDEFARAGALLVRHHGDDPLAVVVGMQLNNLFSFHREALLTGFMASAKSREARGLARLALAQYLELKAELAKHARNVKKPEPQTKGGITDDDGKKLEKSFAEMPEMYAYMLSSRLCDPDLILVEAERLYDEVIAEYADVPFVSLKQREQAEWLKRTPPTYLGHTLTDDEIRQTRVSIDRKLTLGSVAEARLDEMHNLAVGKPAPEIVGVDFDGKPLKLSAYRGKVVVLVFWGSWCGPCMEQVPHERELAERLKDRPFAILGVDCNEAKSAGLKTIKSERITWPNWNDGADGDGPIVKSYHIHKYPTMFVIDAKGIIRHKDVLPGPHLDKAVDTLLEEVATKP